MDRRRSVCYRAGQVVLGHRSVYYGSTAPSGQERQPVRPPESPALIGCTQSAVKGAAETRPIFFSTKDCRAGVRARSLHTSAIDAGWRVAELARA